MLGIFNVHTDVNARDGTWLYGHCKRDRTES